ncbi:dTDP-4-dehydrorhamnose reductase [soil metagenome]
MSKERILITGAGGMLGNAIFPYVTSRFDTVSATDKDAEESWLETLDVRDIEAARKRFAKFQPTLVLHLAACTDLEFCEVQSQVAEETNAYATGEIAALCEEYGATLVYISTAGVFDGTKSGFYTEQDQPNPIMVYGKTKYDGELLAAARCSRHFIVRAGWMVGGGAAKDHKFVHHILGQIVAGEKTIRAVNDRFGTPTYTHDFALNLFRLLESGTVGTYHMVCEGSGTRHDVAKEILDICGHQDIELLSVDSSYFASNYFAPRPVSEMMINANLRAQGLNLMRNWREALRDYILREFSHAMAGQIITGRDRRLRLERRKNDYAWNAIERRKAASRRGLDAGLLASRPEWREGLRTGEVRSA